MELVDQIQPLTQFVNNVLLEHSLGCHTVSFHTDHNSAKLLGQNPDGLQGFKHLHGHTHAHMHAKRLLPLETAE